MDFGIRLPNSQQISGTFEKSPVSKQEVAAGDVTIDIPAGFSWWSEAVYPVSPLHCVRFASAPDNQDIFVAAGIVMPTWLLHACDAFLSSFACHVMLAGVWPAILLTTERLTQMSEPPPNPLENATAGWSIMIGAVLETTIRLRSLRLHVTQSRLEDNAPCVAFLAPMHCWLLVECAIAWRDAYIPSAAAFETDYTMAHADISDAARHVIDAFTEAHDLVEAKASPWLSIDLFPLAQDQERP